MTTQKPVSKNKDVIPSAYHISNPDYVGYISIGADLFYTDYFRFNIQLLKEPTVYLLLPLTLLLIILSIKYRERIIYVIRKN